MIFSFIFYPFVFEEMLLICFKERDFKVIRNSKHTGDGGIDGIVFNPMGQKILVQAKRYRNAINPQHILDFLIVIKQKKANGGYFIHTGHTGEKSKFYKNIFIKIISGSELVKFVLEK